MKDLLILQDLKTLGGKKSKGAKKSGGTAFAELLFAPNPVKLKHTNLLVMQNVFKAKNEIKYKDYKPSTQPLLTDALLKPTGKNEPNLLANLLQNPKNLNEKVAKIVENAKQTNEFLPPRLQISEAEISAEISKSIEDIDYGSELFEDLNFVQILDFLTILKLDIKDAKLNDFKALKHISANETVLKSFSQTPNVHSLLELAKEHELNLSKLTYEKIENNEYNEKIFAKPYPKLYEQNFFAHALAKPNIKKSAPERVAQPLKELLKEPKASLAPVLISQKQEFKAPENTLKSGALNELLSKMAKKDEKSAEKLDEPSKSVAKTVASAEPKIKQEPITQSTIKEMPKTAPLEMPKELKIKPEIPQQQPSAPMPQNTQEIKQPKMPEPLNIEQNSDFTIDSEQSSTITNTASSSEKISLPEALKLDFLTPHKELSKEQTRQVIDNFARDFKEEIERFKAPSHRVSIKLNPKELGEVSVTMIARGSNLHINLNSQNQSTLNLFINHQQEFKTSLVNMGFTGLAMNFGDKKDGQKDQEQQKARKKYEEIEELESSAELPAGINAVLYKYF